MGNRSLKNRRVTVAGLGHFGGGIAVTRWLVEEGARVLVTDTAKAEALRDSVESLGGLDVAYRLGEHREEDFTNTDLVVASPAVPPSNPFLAAAATAGVPVTTEICLFLERCRAPVAGVTGTKGKSTTTSMLAKLLAARGKTWMGGNIGKSLLGELANIQDDHLVVLELSSFMLHYMGLAHISPRAAVVTMVAPDHLQWHGGFEPYLEAKSQIVRHQKPTDLAVIYADCPHAKAFADAAPGRQTLVRDGSWPRWTLSMPGEHNQLNAELAFACAADFGLTRGEAAPLLAAVRALPHRLQLVAHRDGVNYFNDSIATVPEAAVAALRSFPRGKVVQLVGGFDKGLDLSAMCRTLAEEAKAVVCMGQTGPGIAEAIRSADASLPIRVVEGLEDAVNAARSIAADGDVVLLSPGCASYGPFRDFEQRGLAFTRFAKG